MPSVLARNEAVKFVAGKNFTYEGHKYTVGDDCTDAMNNALNLETLVRIRMVIPYVENKKDVPFQFRREVKVREDLFKKLGHIDYHQSRPAPDPEETTVAEVKEYVETHPDAAEDLLEAEQEGKDRVTLVGYLEDKAVDPADYKVEEVLTYVDDNPNQTEYMLEREQAGKNRVTLVEALQERLNAS